MKTIRNLYFLLGIIAITAYACKKVDISKISNEAWNPSLAVPLAKGEFGVYDVLAKKDTGDLIVVGTDGALALVYTSEKVVLSAADIAGLPDQSFNINQSASGYGVAVIPAFNGTQSYSFSDEVSLSNSSSAELYDIDFKNGNLNITVSTTLLHSVKFDLTFPDLTESGSVVTRTIDLVYSGSTPQTGTATVNLNNGFLDLTNGTNGYNELNVDIAIEITGSGAPILGTESIDFTGNLTGLDFDLIHGYFGNTNLFGIMDTVDIKLFNNAFGGNFQLTSPSIDLEFINSFGLPAQATFNSIKTKETGSGTEYPLSGFPPTFNLLAPTTPGQNATSLLSLNTSNTSNLNTIISPTPKKLIYDVDGTANPGGPAVNFVADDSELKIKGTLNLPLEGFATGFMFLDTVEASTSFDPELVESILLRINTDNGFPVEANIKILMVDQNYNLLKDLTNGLQNLIAAAPVDGNGKATTMVNKITDFTLTGSDVQLLKDMKYIIFEVSSQTYQGNLGTVVKMYEDYKFNVRIGMQIAAKVQL